MPTNSGCCPLFYNNRYFGLLTLSQQAKVPIFSAFIGINPLLYAKLDEEMSKYLVFE